MYIATVRSHWVASVPATVQTNSAVAKIIISINPNAKCISGALSEIRPFWHCMMDELKKGLLATN